jgi:hypothetical protein
MAAYPRVRCAQGNLTLAQIKANSRAGTVVLPGSAGKIVTVVDVWMRNVGGNIGGATAIALTETGGTPTTVFSATVGTFDSNVVVRVGVSGTTNTNVGTAMRPGRGLQIGCTVGDVTTHTSLDYTILYTVTG